MAHVSNGMITCLNVLTIFIALSAIGSSAWFHVRSESPCQRVLRTPLLAVGIALLAVSVAGLVGSCCRVTVLLWLYLLVLFLLILGLFAFTIFAIVVTNRGVGKAVSKQGFGDHRLGDYSGWLQKYVVNEANWNQIKSCLIEVELCQGVENGKPLEYYEHHMPPIPSGCCKPPNYCGYEFKNATYWAAPVSKPVANETDCKTWSNVQTRLCFDCESCKTAVLYNIKREWRMLAIINVCILVVVIVVYSVGCCALRNNRHGYARQR